MKKLLTSHAADLSSRARKMLLIDVKRAHLNCERAEDVFMELLEEVGAAQNKVAKLMRWHYGLRPAVAAWESPVRRQVRVRDFEEGIGYPGVTLPMGRKTSIWWCMAITSITDQDASLGWVEELMSQRGRLGPDDHDDREAMPLGKDGTMGFMWNFV